MEILFSRDFDQIMLLIFDYTIFERYDSEQLMNMDGRGSLVPVDLVGHDVVEVISSHETVLVQVSFAENVIDLIFAQVLSQITGNFLEFVHSNFTLDKSKNTERFTSKDPQTLSISARLSFSPNLAVASLKNSAKSMPPD